MVDVSFFHKLDSGKSQSISLGRKTILKRVGICGVNMPSGHSIRFSTVAKHLRVVIDKNLSFDQQVTLRVTWLM